MYKITNNLIDIQEHEYLQAAHTLITRNSHNKKFITLRASKDAYKYSYFPRTIREWNRLPPHIINSPTLNTFINNINKFDLTHITQLSTRTHLPLGF